MALTVATFLLVAVTAVYVVLTWKLVCTTAMANQQSREIARETHRLQMYPLIHCYVKAPEDPAVLVVQNLGSTPASDIEVLVMASYWAEQSPPDELLAGIAAPGQPPMAVTPTPYGQYGLYKHLVYPSFPPR